MENINQDKRWMCSDRDLGTCKCKTIPFLEHR